VISSATPRSMRRAIPAPRPEHWCAEHFTISPMVLCRPHLHAGKIAAREFLLPCSAGIVDEGEAKVRIFISTVRICDTTRSAPACPSCVGEYEGSCLRRRSEAAGLVAGIDIVIWRCRPAPCRNVERLAELLGWNTAS